ncbi:unnamed protein product [Closterium sp. NIES-65]|nr:unnamed protein product [Closterium sp. NIES-65]
MSSHILHCAAPLRSPPLSLSRLSPSSALSHLTPRPSLFRPSRPLTLCLPIVGACYRCLDCSFCSVCGITHHFPPFPSLYPHQAFPIVGPRYRCQECSCCTVCGATHQFLPLPSLYPHQAFPIVGARYSCLDCPERAGFGLCAACYSYPPVLPRPGCAPPSACNPTSLHPSLTSLQAPSCFPSPPPSSAFPPSFSSPLSWFPLSSLCSLPLISPLAIGLPHSGGVLQLSCLPRVSGL